MLGTVLSHMNRTIKEKIEAPVLSVYSRGGRQKVNMKTNKKIQ